MSPPTSAFGPSGLRAALVGLLFLANTSRAFAQLGAITGTVTRADGRPIASAAVRAERSDGVKSADATTDATGVFRLAPLTAGLYNVSVRHLGYRSADLAGGVSNDYRLDGVSMNHPGLGGDLLSVSVDWIESLEVRGLGAGAESGNFQGGIIDAVTQTGSNDRRFAARTNYESPRFAATNL